MVNVKCVGGGGNSSSDVTATRDKIAASKATITHESDDEVVNGTLQEFGATTASNGNSRTLDDAIYIGLTPGVYRTAGSGGYPQITHPLSSLRTAIGYTDTSKVLSGTTIAGQAGTMTNRGAWNATLALSGSVTIPEGYHNGSGKITRPYSTIGATTVTPSASDQTINTSSKIVTGNITCAGASLLQASNIKSGVSIFGVSGSIIAWDKTQVAYNGSTFQGILSGGAVSGPTVYNPVGNPPSNAITGAIDGHERTQRFQQGAMTVSKYFASTGSTGVYGNGVMFYKMVDVTPFSRLSIKQTGTWYVRDVTTSTPDWVYIKADPVLFVLTDDKYYPQYQNVITRPIYAESTGTAPGYADSNGTKNTTWTSVYDLSGWTGSYYLYIGFSSVCEVSNHSANCTINEIKFTV